MQTIRRSVCDNADNSEDADKTNGLRRKSSSEPQHHASSVEKIKEKFLQNYLETKIQVENF